MSFGKRHPTGFGGVDRRRHARQPTDVPAQIMTPAGPARDCRVVDFSSAGARIALASAFGVPPEFELRAGGRVYLVRTVRRGKRDVGVMFT